MAIPLAFDVFRNGRKLCTAGLKGKDGVLTAILTFVKGTGWDHLDITVGGLDSETEEHVTWTRRNVALGDEIVVRIVESVKTSRIRHRSPLDKASNERAEKAHLRKAAKRFGYKLTKV